MKKSFFTLAFIVFCAYGAVAQGISGGLKVGANFANQKYDSDFGDISLDSRTSFHVGGYLNFGVSETFAIQPELLYNSIGAKQDEVAMKTDYLSIPIMLQYSPVPVFNIHAGPQIGLLLSAKAEADGESVDMKDFYKGLDLGVGVGAGVNLPMGLGFSVRYVLGLANIADSSDFGDVKVTNTAFQVSATYRLFGE